MSPLPKLLAVDRISITQKILWRADPGKGYQVSPIRRQCAGLPIADWHGRSYESNRESPCRPGSRGFPSVSQAHPMIAKALTLPSDDGRRLNEDKHLLPFCPATRQPGPNDPVFGPNDRSLNSTLINPELMPQGDVLGEYGKPGLEQRREHACKRVGHWRGSAIFLYVIDPIDNFDLAFEARQSFQDGQSNLRPTDCDARPGHRMEAC
jgi:hypothetical protein